MFIHYTYLSMRWRLAKKYLFYTCLSWIIIILIRLSAVNLLANNYVINFIYDFITNREANNINDKTAFIADTNILRKYFKLFRYSLTIMLLIQCSENVFNNFKNSAFLINTLMVTTRIIFISRRPSYTAPVRTFREPWYRHTLFNKFRFTQLSPPHVLSAYEILSFILLVFQRRYSHFH